MSLRRAARRRAVLSLVVLGSSVLGLSACPSWPDVQTCGQLPDVTACPVGRGGTCDDAECSALYDCVDGDWSLVERCPEGQGPSSSQAGGEGGEAKEGEACETVSIDRGGEALGCEPDLQEPDCPATAAEGCSPCLTGCVDFFLCTAPGWQVVAHCDEDGRVQLEP